jgi:hypothetical protein
MEILSELKEVRTKTDKYVMEEQQKEEQARSSRSRRRFSVSSRR